jgi:hypothetical protein
LTRIEWNPVRLPPSFSKGIAGRDPQVLIGRRVVNHLELAEEPAIKIGRDQPRPNILDEEGSLPFVAKAQDHRGGPMFVSMRHP